MTTVTPFSEARAYTPLESIEHRGAQMAAAFASAPEEYSAAHGTCVCFDRTDRGLLTISGDERKPWLHSLVTNSVTTLDDNAGVYAFAVNVKGRILFDVNILCLHNALWLDLDLLAVDTAIEHFDRHLFTENVRIGDTTTHMARIACCGSQAAWIAGQLGVTDLPAAAALVSFALPQGDARLMRNDFAGIPGFDVFVPRAEGPAWWDRLVGLGARPAGCRTLDLLRIEAGIPWLGPDLNEGVLPSETGQLERGVSHQKGCYLGQEIVERMRSRGTVARRLVRLRVADGEGLDLPATLQQNTASVGTMTSLARHPLRSQWVGLGYLRSGVTDLADITVGDPPRDVTIGAD